MPWQHLQSQHTFTTCCHCNRKADTDSAQDSLRHMGCAYTERVHQIPCWIKIRTHHEAAWSCHGECLGLPRRHHHCHCSIVKYTLFAQMLAGLPHCSALVVVMCTLCHGTHMEAIPSILECPLHRTKVSASEYWNYLLSDIDIGTDLPPMEVLAFL